MIDERNSSGQFINALESPDRRILWLRVCSASLGDVSRQRDCVSRTIAELRKHWDRAENRVIFRCIEFSLSLFSTHGERQREFVTTGGVLFQSNDALLQNHTPPGWERKRLYFCVSFLRILSLDQSTLITSTLRAPSRQDFFFNCFDFWHFLFRVIFSCCTTRVCFYLILLWYSCPVQH